MVAMGASLADRAWGRDSAVYRITGVFVVISGWFLTSLFAFIMAFLIAGFIYLTRPYGLFVMLFITAVALYKSAARTRRKHREEQHKIEQE